MLTVCVIIILIYGHYDTWFVWSVTSEMGISNGHWHSLQRSVVVMYVHDAWAFDVGTTGWTASCGVMEGMV